MITIRKPFIFLLEVNMCKMINANLLKILKIISLTSLILLFFNPLFLHGAITPFKIDESVRDEIPVASPGIVKGVVAGNQEASVSLDRLYVYMPEMKPGLLEMKITSIDGVYVANIIYKIPSGYSKVVELEFPTENYKLLRNYKIKQLILYSEFKEENTPKPVVIVSSWDKLENLSDVIVYFNSSRGEKIKIMVPRRDKETPQYGHLVRINSDENTIAYNSFIKLTTNNIFLFDDAKILREIDRDVLKPKHLIIKLPND